MVTTVYDRNALAELVRSRALRFGDFTLASGKKAKFYLDCKQITLASAGARLVGEGMLDLLADSPPAAVGGMSIGADPIVAAIITLADLRQLDLAGFLVRKEPKGHGTNRYIEGPVAAGQNVAIVEDVVTTGGSSLLAIERAEEFGLKVVHVLTIVDRLEGGREAFESRGYRFSSLFTIRDFGIEPAG
ncbi:MAG: orotate phosphoribosyltransferase [Pirellulales bacterium]|nr:orotate phosphoribosyltransferase [Pirellulales bacterium]